MNQIMKMNKILVDNEICELKDFNGKLEFKNNSKVVIDGNCKVYVNKNINDLEFILNDNANLDIVFFDSDKCSDTKLIFNQNNSSYLKIKDLFESSSIIKHEVYINVNGNNSFADLNISCVSNKNSINIIEQINVNKESRNNEATERVKGLVDGGNIEVLPNMCISTNDIVANHFVTISSYDTDSLFYLQSKGLTEEKAKNLIKKSYLYNEYRGDEYE